jgi:hypothetical protein
MIVLGLERTQFLHENFGSQELDQAVEPAPEHRRSGSHRVPLTDALMAGFVASGPDHGDRTYLACSIKTPKNSVDTQRGNTEPSFAS